MCQSRGFRFGTWRFSELLPRTTRSKTGPTNWTHPPVAFPPLFRWGFPTKGVVPQLIHHHDVLVLSRRFQNPAFAGKKVRGQDRLSAENALFPEFIRHGCWVVDFSMSFPRLPLPRQFSDVCSAVCAGIATSSFLRHSIGLANYGKLAYREYSWYPVCKF